MPGTTAGEDCAFFDTTLSKPKKPRRANGALVYAGTHWPDKARRSDVYHTVKTAFDEARSLITQGYLTATAAVSGSNDEAVVRMTRWFGARDVSTGSEHRDWWKGAKAILGAIEDFVTSDIKVYYRGDALLIGRPNDYPDATTSHATLTAHDLSGYAESCAGSKDNIIGLCRLFFERSGKKSSEMRLTGADSAGGTLIHELSHNVCETDDHEAWDGGTCYGVDACLELAANLPSRAFYNADNIEYFCEDIRYNFPSTVAPPPVTTGASRTVSTVRSGLAGRIPLGTPMLAVLPVSYTTWKEKTARAQHWRSGDLVAVDEALRIYAPANRANLKRVFEHWYRNNPKEASKRNVDGCVVKLKDFLGVV